MHINLVQIFTERQVKPEQTYRHCLDRDQQKEQDIVYKARTFCHYLLLLTLYNIYVATSLLPL